ncbi:MAG: hypothetical protein H7A01_13965 [Hahellaceae bacterium]|nr:hypothetical protein [Hahellaceae bacterium]MCP5210162.1 hypothetical protein [Hahellaceae bacterium]
MKNLVKSVAFGALLSIGLTACGGGASNSSESAPVGWENGGGAVSDDNGTVYAVMSNVNIGQEYALSPSNGEMWVEVPLQKGDSFEIRVENSQHRSTDGLDVSLHDADFNVLVEAQTLSTAARATLVVADNDNEESVFVRVAGKEVGSFRFTVVVYAASSVHKYLSQTEPNNIRSFAFSLTRDMDHYGLVDFLDSDDWYSFDVKQGDEVHYAIINENQSTDGITLQLYDDSGEPLREAYKIAPEESVGISLTAQYTGKITAVPLTFIIAPSD